MGLERASNKSQHTKLTLETKNLPPLLPGFELATFRSRVRRAYQQAIPVPRTRAIRSNKATKNDEPLQISHVMGDKMISGARAREAIVSLETCSHVGSHTVLECENGCVVIVSFDTRLMLAVALAL